MRGLVWELLNTMSAYRCDDRPATVHEPVAVARHVGILILKESSCSSAGPRDGECCLCSSPGSVLSHASRECSQLRRRGGYVHPTATVHLEGRTSIPLGRYSRVCARSLLFIAPGAELTIGDNSFVGTLGNLRIGHALNIGTNVVIGQFVSLLCYDHVADPTDLPMLEQGYRREFDHDW